MEFIYEGSSEHVADVQRKHFSIDKKRLLWKFNLMLSADQIRNFTSHVRLVLRATIGYKHHGTGVFGPSEEGLLLKSSNPNFTERDNI